VDRPQELFPPLIGEVGDLERFVIAERLPSTTWHDMPMMKPEQIHTMSKDVALMVHPGQPPALVDLIPYTERLYARALAVDRPIVTEIVSTGSDSRGTCRAG
jgi:hypothetical protein